ncbi:hypothetical protein NOVA_17940 [Nocardia nova]|uniref:hypothetical protein n=1 Tax=Nocardia nova TaxID=37330 RepID=UPI001C450DD0|nr:hypothetical protein [Nocardia nova]MBV7704656.1 hypothetical protein [Nocardia nova]
MSIDRETPEYPWLGTKPNSAVWFDLDSAIRQAISAIGDPETDNLNSTRDSYSEAIQEFLEQIRILLFVEPEIVITGNDSVESYLAEYLDIKHLNEMKIFLFNKLENLSDERLRQSLGSIFDFLKRWVDESSSQLNVFEFVPRGSAKQAGSISETQAISHWKRRLSAIQREAESAIASANAVRQAETFVVEAERASSAARQAAGLAGNNALSTHFSELSTEEAVRAFRWTLVAIASLLSTVLLGFAFSWWRVFDSMWASIVGHLAVILPMIAVATYSASIAHHHRTSALWASSAAVQLNTVAAYVEQLTLADSRESIVYSLGTRVFAAPDLTGATPTDKVTVFPPAVVDLIKDLISAVKKDGPDVSSTSPHG